jgi:hypothetical protein
MPPRSTINSLRRQYQVDPIEGQPDRIPDHNGPIDDQTGIVPNAPSNITHSADIAQDALGNIEQNESPGHDQRAPSIATAATHSEHNITNPRASTETAPPVTNTQRDSRQNFTDLLRPTLPRTNSTGIGRFSVDTERLLDSLHLDTMAPIPGAQRLHLHDATAQHHENQADIVPSMQMSQPTFFDALVRMMRALGATADEADQWAVNHIFGDENVTGSSRQMRITDEAVRRTRIAYPNLDITQPSAPALEAPAPTNTDMGAPVVSGHGTSGAVLSGPNARFTISYPPRFKPNETNWFLWVPLVKRFLSMVKLDPRILSKTHAHRFSSEQHANALSIISEIAPERESQWFARLNFTQAHSAWDELAHAYAPRAELELQAKIEDLENISQSDAESIREWTLRLRRLVLEVKAMHGEHVVTETSHKLKLLRIRPIPGQEDGFSTFIGDLRHTLHLKTVEEVESKLTAYEDGIQMQARLRHGAQVWHTYAGTSSKTGRHSPAPRPSLPTAATFKRAPRGHCYICFNDTPRKTVPHHMKDCYKKDQPLGKRVVSLMQQHKAANPRPPPALPFTPMKRGATS